MNLSGANTLMGQKSGVFDGHAHIFKSSLPMAETRRYKPAYDALLTEYATLLKSAGLDGALLVQPSFLGTDNSYLIEMLAQSNDIGGLCFRGVAVVDADITTGDLERMHDAGIVGVRFNLVGQEREIDPAMWKRLFDFVATHDWHIEIQCEGETLAPKLNVLLDHCARVVVDHYGLPNPKAPLECPGFSAICNSPSEQIFVKLSAPYRVFKDTTSHEAASKCVELATALLRCHRSDRLLWGSDWPWTQFEGRHSYADTLLWMAPIHD